MKNIEEVLQHFGINGEIVRVNDGPLIKQIEFLPDSGTKIKNISNITSDIARELGVSSFRVDNIENSHNLSLEIPQETMKTVDFNAIVSSNDFRSLSGNLPVNLGVDIGGDPVFADISKMPHLLVGGTTGSGKSVALNVFILSLILSKSPEDVKFILIDPKRIEFSIYNNQSYMLFPVFTDNESSAQALEYLVSEMERRYQIFENSRSRNIQEYKDKGNKMNYIVCIVDEFSDLILSNKKVEKLIQLLAQKSRACGIHLILATQRPSVDVVTGAIKANFPTRMSFKTASSVDSRTILDTSGAESLIGRGDALYLPSGGNIKRVHGAYISDENIDNILRPYRGNVAPFTPPASTSSNVSAQSSGKDVAPHKPEKSWFRKMFDTWSSMTKKQQKTIIAGFTWLIAFLLGNNKKK